MRVGLAGGPDGAGVDGHLPLNRALPHRCTPMPGFERLGTLLDCKDATRLISRALDGPLPFGRRICLALHLRWCDACRRFERQTLVLRAAMRRYRQ